MKSKLPIFNFRLLAIFVTDGAMVDVGFAAPDLQARAWASHGELNPSSMLAVGRTYITASIDIFTGCEIKNRRARCDRAGHPPPMPNCTNSNASCPATLLRNQGCRVHQQARSWLQERLAEAQFYPCPNCPIKLSCLDCPVCAIAQLLPSNNSYRSLAKTLNLQKVLKFDSCTSI